jgi:pimeloyl-ACP methyl ester carboxylesterase
VDRHLRIWRGHPAYRAARERAADDDEARVALVAHSMGGLVCQAMGLLSGAMDVVRTTITLGTPFYGAVKAAMILNAGSGAPVPLSRRRLRRLAATLPGLHDLLPMDRSVAFDDEARRLTADDVAALGGDRDLARDAFARHRARVVQPLPGHRGITGIAQPTAQMLRLRDGVVEPLYYRYIRHPDDELVRERATGRPYTEDRGGDGTVYRYATHLPGVAEEAFGQQHSGLARTDAIFDVIGGALTGKIDLGRQLGPRDLGLDAPDEVAAGEPLRIGVRGEADPSRLTCRVEPVEPDDGLGAALTLLPSRSDAGTDEATLTGTARLIDPGLFRIVVRGGRLPVTKLVLVHDGQDAGAED